eukprot:SAG31_NODE_14096_length_827_cov_1.965659_1_plen_60_part_10
MSGVNLLALPEVQPPASTRALTPDHPRPRYCFEIGHQRNDCELWKAELVFILRTRKVCFS